MAVNDIYGMKYRKVQTMNEVSLAENLVEFFSDSERQRQSGFGSAAESSLLMSSREITEELEKQGKIIQSGDVERAITSNDIEVLGPTDYGPRSRTTQIVSFGHSLFGLNTENNVREALRRYFMSNGYDTVIEFDAGPENTTILSQSRFSVHDVRMSRNGRDLLAVKFRGKQKDVWFVELKGHSGVEDWDFFTGLRQLLVLLDLRTRIVDLGKSTAEIRCAFAVPFHNVKAHGGKPCYSKELAKIHALMEGSESWGRFVGKRTYEYLVKAIKEYRLIELLAEENPIVHFLKVKGVDLVRDLITNRHLREILW